MNWEGGLWIKIKQEKIYGKEDTAENYILEEWGQSMFMLWSKVSLALRILRGFQTSSLL